MFSSSSSKMPKSASVPIRYIAPPAHTIVKLHDPNFRIRVRKLIEEGDGYAVIPDILTATQCDDLNAVMKNTVTEMLRDIPEPISLAEAVPTPRGIDSGLYGNCEAKVLPRAAAAPVFARLFNEFTVGAMDAMTYNEAQVADDDEDTEEPEDPEDRVYYRPNWLHTDISPARADGPVPKKFRSMSYEKRIKDHDGHWTWFDSSSSSSTSPTSAAAASMTDAVQGLVNVNSVHTGDATFVCIPGSQRSSKEAILAQKKAFPKSVSGDFNILGTAALQSVCNSVATSPPLFILPTSKAHFDQAGQDAMRATPIVALRLPEGCVLLWSSALVHQGTARPKAEIRARGGFDPGRFVVYVCGVPMSWINASGKRQMLKNFARNAATDHRPLGRTKKIPLPGVKLGLGGAKGVHKKLRRPMPFGFNYYRLHEFLRQSHLFDANSRYTIIPQLDALRVSSVKRQLSMNLAFTDECERNIVAQEKKAKPKFLGPKVSFEKRLQARNKQMKISQACKKKIETLRLTVQELENQRLHELEPLLNPKDVGCGPLDRCVAMFLYGKPNIQRAQALFLRDPKIRKISKATLAELRAVESEKEPSEPEPSESVESVELVESEPEPSESVELVESEKMEMVMEGEKEVFVID